MLKNFRKKKVENLPWIDKECLCLIARRDKEFHRASILSNDRSSMEWASYKNLRNSCKATIRSKMNAYFEDKDSRFFKSSKNFWKFYKKFIKSGRSSTKKINEIKLSNGRLIDSDHDIANEFNKFISDLKSPTSVPESDSIDFIQSNFNNLKRDNKILIDACFQFKPCFIKRC